MKEEKCFKGLWKARPCEHQDILLIALFPVFKPTSGKWGTFPKTIPTCFSLPSGVKVAEHEHTEADTG